MSDLVRKVVEEGAAVEAPRDKFIFAWAQVLVSIRSRGGSRVLSASVIEAQGFERGSIILDEPLPVPMIVLPIPLELQAAIDGYDVSNVMWMVALHASTHPIAGHFLCRLITPRSGEMYLEITTTEGHPWMSDRAMGDVEFEVSVLGSKTLLR